MRLASRSLEQLDLHGCANLAALTLDAPRLLSLDCSYCTKFPDAAIEAALGAVGGTLRELLLRSGASLERPTLVAPALVSLSLCLCSHLASPTIVAEKVK